jgi:hypothetical protein
VSEATGSAALGTTESVAASGGGRGAAVDEAVRNELLAIIEDMEVPPEQRHYLRTRYAGQVAWMEGKAQSAQRRFVWLRLITVIGAVIVPVLVGLTPGDDDLQTGLRVATVVISLIVAVCAAVEQFFHYGSRWQHYRRTIERLKSEGWRYFELIDDYAAKNATHTNQFPRFARRVEDLMQEESDVYLREVVAERRHDRTTTGEEGGTQDGGK